jgi:hypothetical protein
MSLLNNLERKFGRFAVPNLTMALIAGQVVVFVLALGFHRQDNTARVAERLALIPERVLEGEAWRLATFLVMPPFGNIVCALFFWYLFYLMGNALEHSWGTFRYNVFLFIGYAATVGAAFCFPDEPASNAYLMATVFLAFATLYPDFELYIFFILPVKIKWLALAAWIGYVAMLVFGDWASRLLVFASLSNYFVFFGKDLLARAELGRQRMAAQAPHIAVRQRPYFHRCTVCGITDRTHPAMEFRYCSQCDGDHGYCSDHLRNHDHVVAMDEQGK